MEDSSKPLATESFSYSWLTHQKPSSSHNDLLDSISAEKFLQNFDFDVPVTGISGLVDADEIFSDGQIKPVYAHRSITKAEASTTNSVPGSPVSSINTLVNKNLCFIKKWRNSYRRILHKCCGFLKPLYQALGSSTNNIRVVDLDRKDRDEIQSLSGSLEPSPRNSSDYNDHSSVMDFDKSTKIEVRNGMKRAESWRTSPQVVLCSPSDHESWCDMESAIHEAILYCKRSIEK